MELARAQAWSAAVIVVAALGFIAAERRWPYDRGQGLLRQGFWNDLLLYTFLQSWLAGMAIAHFAAWLDRATAGRPAVVTEWPLWAQLLLFTVTHDLYIWWFHRLCHRNRVLWRLHEAHHSPRVVDWLSGARSHVLEILINGVVEFMPIILLGAAPEVATYKGCLSAVYGMFIHANLDVRLGALGYILNGPALHRWHHAERCEVRFRNFGTKLAIWDRLFGTAYEPDRRPLSYGLPYRFPADDWLRQHLASLRPFERRDVA
ncbi:MAG: sterol desaturase family protein [bacterium]|nr:sterol desaturase family protein [bacterium]